MGGSRNRGIWQALAAGIAMALACVAPAAEAGGKVETGLSLPSPTLDRPIPYAVYLPKPASLPGERFPVLYLLHGRDDDETAWLKRGDIAAILDRKIAAGELQPIIVVMPMAANSWYVDDARPAAAGFGPVASAFASDLIAGIDARYPTAACRQARAIGGLSMGGFGAIGMSFDRPDLFTAAFSLSGSLFSEQAEDIAARRPRYNVMFGGVYGDPFEVDRFRAWTVFARLNRAGDRAKQVAVWLAAGDEDFPSILSGTTRLHQELRQRGVSSELRITDGDHTWPLWSRAVDPALSWASVRLAPVCGEAPEPGVNRSTRSP